MKAIRSLVLAVLVLALVLLMALRYGFETTWTRAGVTAGAGAIVGVLICVVAARPKKIRGSQ